MSGIKARKPHTFWGYEPLRTLNKYFDDGFCHGCWEHCL